MRIASASVAPQILKLLIALLIGKVLAGVVLNYRDYLPPNFQADFLLGREPYFWDGYHGAFYLHIFAGPGSLLLGTLLINDQFRRRFPKWHRRIGRVQAMCVLLVVAPSGLWMARHAANGPASVAGFTILAVLTGLTIVFGWRAAMQRQIDVHRRWMTRNYILLFSAVLVRVNGGVGELLHIDADWFYAQAAWTSWLVPLAIYECVRARLSPRSVTGGQVRATTAIPIGPPSLTGG